jgi:hypothetical protein
MTKPLTIVCLIVLIASAGMAALLNFQSVEPLKEKAQRLDESKQARAQIDWRGILSQLPQYSPKKIEETSLKGSNTSPDISDSFIVGIVADIPRSAHMHLPSQVDGAERIVSSTQRTNSIVQLTVGQGWLDDWEIEQILPDSIVWQNNKTKGSYIQPLFVTPNTSEVEAQNLPSGKK